MSYERDGRPAGGYADLASNIANAFSSRNNSDPSKEIINSDGSVKELESLSSSSRAIDTTESRETFRKYLVNYIFCIMVAFGGFLLGYDIGTVGGYFNMKIFQMTYGEENGNGMILISGIHTGLLVGLFDLGAAAGGILFSRIGEKYGRRIGIMVAVVVYMIGIVVQMASTKSWIQIMIGRMITGLGVGTLVILSPVLVSETSPKSFRGSFVATFSLMITFGVFIGNLINKLSSTRNDPGQWRIPMGFAFLWAILLLIGVYFSPESPRYLIQANKIDEAKAAIANSNRLKLWDPRVDTQLNEIVEAVNIEKTINQTESTSWRELFVGKPRIRYRLFLCVGMNVFQQLTGISYFLYYGTHIFKDIGVTDPFTIQLIFGSVGFGSTFIALYTVQKFGRRRNLLAGTFVMFSCIALFTSLSKFALYPNGSDSAPNEKISKFLIALVCIYIVTFSISWSPVLTIIGTETLPQRIRAKGISIGVSANWLTSFTVLLVSPYAKSQIGFYYGYVFTGTLLLSVIFVFLVIPETKGLSLEQIDELYRSGVKPWRT